MDKPNVDKIEGLSPAISIDQKSGSQNPRSTVGTITEIYDYLRVLYARIGHPHCPKCHREISRSTPEEITLKMLKKISEVFNQEKIKPVSFMIVSPVIREKKGEFSGLFENLRKKGFTKIKVDNYWFNLNQEINLIKTNKHSIDVVVDEFTYTKNKFNSDQNLLKKRINQAVELASELSQGLVNLIINEKEEVIYSMNYFCPVCDIAIPELEPRLFSFNSPLGACSKCKGLGIIYKVNEEAILNKNLSINEGAILPFNKLLLQNTWYIRLLKKALEEEMIDMDKPLSQFKKEELKILLYGTGKVYRVRGYNRQGQLTSIYEKFDGIVSELERRFFQSDEHIFEWERYIKEEICDQCHGKRLSKEALSVTVAEYNIAALSDLSIDKVANFFKDKIWNAINEFEQQIAKSIVEEINYRLNFLVNVGLSYLTLGREAKSLSGGELQRIRLASQIGTGLTGVLYVLDEPSIGLHPKDIDALIETLKHLKNIGNSVVVVEHDPKMILSSDYLIELGPKAGNNGGKLIYQGKTNELKKHRTLTAKYIFNPNSIALKKFPLNKNKGELILHHAKANNLKNITVKFPLGNLIAVTGVSGSGKSTLVVDTLYPALKYYLQGHYQKQIGEYERLEGHQYINRVYLVDQSPIGKTPRSNPATYVGFFDQIREIFAQTVDAKMRGFTKSRFSFNLKGGRCEKCQGSGLIKIEMQFLSDVYIKCDLCQGQRYNEETLSVKFRDKNIYQILEMTVDEGLVFFANHEQIYQKLKILIDVGLGYLKLGQPATTLSGGEAQRIKLAAELSRNTIGNTLYILDEPTTGLHLYDVEKLIKVLYQLVQRGSTVVIIEHNLEVLKHCQYIIDLGPEGGEKGGDLVYQGETGGIIKEERSWTGKYLNGLV
jgi:excinuclease ABC subunit A